MIVDCHTHVKFDSEKDASEHLAVMGTVDSCFVMPDSDGINAETNSKLAEYVGRDKKLVGFAVLNPVDQEVQESYIDQLTSEMHLSGVVLYCSVHGYHPAHSGAMKFYEMAESKGIPVFFHGGGRLDKQAILEYAQPYMLDEVARSFPKLKMVIGTMGRPFTEQTYAILAKHENVYADLTVKSSNVWQIYNMVMAAFENDVMHKLLFGSGYPLGTPGDCMETLLGFNKLIADMNMPRVPRGTIRGVIERDTLNVLGIKS